VAIASAILNGPAEITEIMMNVITMTRYQILMMRILMMSMMGVVCKAGPGRMNKIMTKTMMTKIMVMITVHKVSTATIDRAVLEAAAPGRGGVQDRDLE